MTEEEATVADEIRKLQLKQTRLAREKQQAGIKGRGRGYKGASEASGSRGPESDDRGRQTSRDYRGERARSVSSLSLIHI